MEMFRLVPTRRIRVSALVAVILVAGWVVSCGGSSGDDGGRVEVSIESIDPEPTSAGVETTIDFAFEPTGDLSASELGWRVEFGDGTSQSGEPGAATEVSHAWEQSGTFNLEVAAVLEGSTLGSARREFEVLGPVDVAVSEVSGRPLNVQSGDLLTIQFDVANQSANDLQTPFETSVFLIPDDGSAVDADRLAQAEPIATETIGSGGEVVLEAGGTRTAGPQVTIPDDIESGAYRIVGWVSPEGQLGDDTPENNFAVGSEPDGIVQVESSSTLLPDVDVRDVSVIPDRAFPALNELQRGFSLVNNGDTDAVGVTTETFLSEGDPEIDDDDLMVASSEEPVDVPAGSSVEVGPEQIVLNDDITAESGEKEVYVVVRASLDGEEANRENNVGVSDPPITVSDERADGPDIVVDEFHVEPSNTFLGGSLQVTGDVSNQGNVDVSSFICRVYLGQAARVDLENDSSFDTVTIQKLDSGESVEVDQTVTVNEIDASAGTFNVYMFCDPNGALDETFRGNNARIDTDPVEISETPNVDLQVASLDVPSSVQDGNDVTVTAEVCVSGDNASGETRGALYQTPGSTVDFSEEPLQTFAIPNINPGECQSVDVTYEADCRDFIDTYAIGVKIDTRDDLPENDEMNNSATGGNNLTMNGEFCSCPTDTFDPNDQRFSSATLQTPGKKSATICEPGDCDFFDIKVEENESLRVETTFRSEKGDLETTLFDPSGVTALDRDTTEDRQRVATFNVPSKDDYIFNVCAATPSTRNLYDMNVEIIPQPSGVDLIPRRPELPSSTTYTLGESLQTDLRVHNIGDRSSGSFDVEFVITPDRKVDDGDDVPLDPSTVSVGTVNPTSRADTSNQLEIPTSLSKGDYYIAAKVDPTNQVTEADNSNNVAFSKQITIETRCFDALEPNDSFANATPVSAGTFNNLTSCASENDYYELCLDSGEKFTTTVNYDPQEGDVDLELYNRNQQLIDSSATTGQGTETVSVNFVNGSQCYFIRPLLLTQQSMARTTYDMDIQVNNVRPSLQCTSRFEPNDSFQSATSLIKATQQSRSGTIDRCPASDDEFYRLNLSQGQTVSLTGTISPSSQPGNLRLQLYKPNQQPVRTKSTSPGSSSVQISNYTAPTGGTFFLEVTLTATQRNVTYELGAQGLGGIDLKTENVGGFVTAKTYSPGDSLSVQFDITNLRSDRAKTPSYTVYLGDKSTLDRQNDTQLATGTLGSDVPGNSTVTDFTTITIPSSAPSGTGYLHVEVDPDSTQTDPNMSNDVASASISLQ